jgi:hypothetical protein
LKHVARQVAIPEVGNLRAEEERSLAAFTRRLIEIAAAAGARGSAPSPTAALNAMCLPAIALDQDGFVADANAAAETIFDNNVKIKDRRLFVRDPAARALLKDAIDQWRTSPRLNPFSVRTKCRLSCEFGLRQSELVPLLLQVE